MQKILEKIIWGLIVLIWLSHLVQVFTPEVGFDAVWYHLPVIKAIIDQRRLIFIPSLYQSVNPLFSDLIFGVGFLLAQELGAKLVAYLFGLLLAISSYYLSKKIMNRSWALLTVMLVSTFQVVAWQSASFYVDVAKAVWEIWSLLFLLRWRDTHQQKWLLVAGVLFGASLASKLFSIFLWPVLIYLVFSWSHKHRFKNLSIFTMSSLVLPLPFYIFAYLKTGHPFFSFSQHLLKLDEIGGTSSLTTYFGERTGLLYTLPSELILARDYTSFLLILFLPILAFLSQEIKKDEVVVGLGAFATWQTLLWWYLPPLSTRYSLSGFVIWMIVSIWGASKLSEQHLQFYQPILATIFLATMINLAPRLVVNARSLRYLSGRQSKDQFIRQFFDGHIDSHLSKWHQLN